MLSKLKDNPVNWILVIVVVLLSSLLFVSGPDNYDNRVVKQIWESGHFILFSVLIFIALQTVRLNKFSFISLFVGVTIFSIGIGLITEIIQNLVGRSFEYKDILNDLLGGYAGLLFALISKQNPLKLNLLFFCVFLILCGIGFRTLFIVAVDDWRMKHKFPILSDFESQYQIERWGTRLAKRSLSEDQKRGGNYALKVDFTPGLYPYIALRKFKRDWRNYSYIQFSVFNENQTPIKLDLKIYDVLHPITHYQYSDSFHSNITVHSGWNDYSFSLKDIRSAPKGRNMEMQAILNVGLFAIELKKPTTIYIDDVRLSH